MAKKNLKITFVSYYPEHSYRSGHPVYFWIVKTLRDIGFELEIISGLDTLPYKLLKIKSFFYNRLLKKYYLRMRDPILLRGIGSRVSKFLSKSDSDIVFAPGSMETTFINTDKPIVFWTDATFQGLYNFYPDYTNYSQKVLSDEHTLEQKAMNNCSLAIFSSHWASQSAISDYNLSPQKVLTLPFGCTHQLNITEQDILKNIESKSLDKIEILFIGYKWRIKGGDKLVEAVKMLNDSGVPTHLHLVGVDSSVLKSNPEYISVHGILSKDNPEEHKKLDELFLKAHFFVLPSRNEAFGLVFSEAAARGAPVIGTNVGGIPTAINHGVNGFLVNPDNAAKEIAEIIKRYHNNVKAYRKLAHSTYRDYWDRLDWKVSGEILRERLLALVEESGKAK